MKNLLMIMVKIQHMTYFHFTWFTPYIFYTIHGESKRNHSPPRSEWGFDLKIASTAITFISCPLSGCISRYSSYTSVYLNFTFWCKLWSFLSGLLFLVNFIKNWSRDQILVIFTKNWSCNKFQLSLWPNFGNFYQKLVTQPISSVITTNFNCNPTKFW